MDEITNSGRLGLKSPKFHFLPFLAAQKFIAHRNIQIHVTGLIFILNLYFLNARNNVLYQNQQQLKLPKYANYLQDDPLIESSLQEITRKKCALINLT